MPRRSIDIDTLIHANPIPCASRVGPLVMSSIIPPYAPGTREVPDDLDDQVAAVFDHVDKLLAEAGGGWDDVAMMTFYVKDPGTSRPAVNSVWEQKFPDPESRPARYNQRVPADNGPVQISCTFTAYIE